MITKKRTQNELKSIRSKSLRILQKELKRPPKVLKLKMLTKEFIKEIQPETISNDLLWKNSVYYVIHCILRKITSEKFKTDTRKKGFVALSFEDLKKVLSVNTKLTIQTLIENEIIECDNHYVTNIVSHGYKISKKFRDSEISFTTLTHPLLLKRYKRFNQDYIKIQMKLISKNAHLTKWFLRDDLKINKPDALEFLKLTEINLKSIIRTSNLTLEEKSKALDKVKTIISKAKEQVQNFDCDLPTFSEKGGRMFTSLTALMSLTRHFIEHNNENLVYFDIKNSQPFHFIHFLNPTFWNKTTKHSDIILNNLNNVIYDYVCNHKSYTTTIMSLKDAFKKGLSTTNKGITRISDTRQKYAHLVSKGKLYKFISDKFKMKFVDKHGVDPFRDEKSTKKELIQMLYSNDKNKHSKANTYFKEFRKLFPLESQIITLLKSRYYKDFSVLLQKVESEILLGFVCKRIYNLNPSIPLYTIHDGIMTSLQYEEVLNNTIQEVYKEAMGVKPELKKEYMKPDNAYNELHEYSLKKVKTIFEDLGYDIEKITMDFMITNFKQKPKSEFIFPHDLFVDYTITTQFHTHI
ncbi:DUF1542 domain-containing protein [Flavobacterium sp.]|jgi:hypothetical protein|uniref:DUF1542 domain-containing protein n=1 Tax=Flavobacterium sp. TaxID=239 RepID=UPI0037C09BD8